MKQAEKTAAITQCWESLISNAISQRKTALSLILHRITGSREETYLFHIYGMGIFYTYVRLLMNTWAKAITQNYKIILKKQFNNRESVHISFGNSDSKQQTLTGYYTTHHTTGTIFQPNNVINNDEAFYLKEFDFGNGVGEGEINYGAYKIPKKRESIQSFPEFNDQFSDASLLTTYLGRDMAWAIAKTVGADSLEDLGFEYEKESL